MIRTEFETISEMPLNVLVPFFSTYLDELELLAMPNRNGNIDHL